MKCPIHNAEATGVCAYCGRGLCSQCLEGRSTPKASLGSAEQAAPAGLPERLACSSECAVALIEQANALRQLLKQSHQNARASAFYCYLCGGLSAVASVVAYFMLPSPFLIIFTAGCAAALILSGFWYGRSARKSAF